MKSKRPPIIDEFTYQPISHQQRSTLRRLRDRKCVNCGEKLSLEWKLTRCDFCNERVKQNKRTRLGFKPWMRGGSGHPPWRRDAAAIP